MTPAGLVIRQAHESDLGRVVELLLLGPVPGGPPGTEDVADLGPHRAALRVTSNTARPDAHRFSERLGFVPSHVGFKMRLT